MGWPHPDYLLEVLTGGQLAGWADFYSREPWGFALDDLRHSQALSLAANAAGVEPKTTPDTFSMVRAIREGPLDEDGNPTEEALARKIHAMLAGKRG